MKSKKMNTKIQRLAFLFAILVSASLVVGLRAEEVNKPNILFIMLDDLGKEWVSCYGAGDIKTPNIDALAAGGMKFNNAYSMPQCTPTRVTLLTGQYPWRTGWVNHWDVPRFGVGYFDWKRHTTFATIMKSAGYTTAIAGKWQINDFRLEPMALEKHGFDDWCVWTGYESQNPPSAERYWDPYIHTRDGSRTREGEFGPDVYADFLIEFIRRNKDKPMMLYWPMALTHGPLVATPKEKEASGKWDRHKAMVRYTDHLVGRMVAAIDEAGIRGRTIIIFTTDNGSGGGVHGTIRGEAPAGGKASNFEGGICQPFIVNGPGRIPGGRETDALTDFTDMLPTFAELGDASIPAGLTLDGVSIAPLITGRQEDSNRQWILAMGHGAATLDENGVRGRTDYMERVLRDKRFKVWVNPEREIDRLYDLQDDSHERHNLLKGGSLTGAQEAALGKFRKIVATMPPRDERPRYEPRAANAWDRKAPAKQTSQR